MALIRPNLFLLFKKVNPLGSKLRKKKLGFVSVMMTTLKLQPNDSPRLQKSEFSCSIIKEQEMDSKE